MKCVSNVRITDDLSPQITNVWSLTLMLVCSQNSNCYNLSFVSSLTRYTVYCLLCDLYNRSRAVTRGRDTRAKMMDRHGGR